MVAVLGSLDGLSVCFSEKILEAISWRVLGEHNILT